MAQQIKKERLPLQSVIFSLTECSAALAALEEINTLHTQIRGMNLLERENLILRPETIVTLVGATRDFFVFVLQTFLISEKTYTHLKNTTMVIRLIN